MTIGEMHVWFRQYAQQMGMQNVRAILPEQIDVLINTAITDTINELVRTNIGLTSDRVVTDNSKIGQINALRSIYKVKEITFSDIYTYNLSFTLDGDLIVTTNRRVATLKDARNVPTTAFKRFLEDTGLIVNSITINPSGSCSLNVTCFNVNTEITTNGSERPNIKLNGSTSQSGSFNYTCTKENPYITFNREDAYPGLIRINLLPFKDVLYFVDFSINYKTGYLTTGKGATYDNGFTTNLFPIRLIDDNYLADTLNDFVLKPRFRSPVGVVYADTLDLYVGQMTQSGGNYYVDKTLAPYVLRISYLTNAGTVYYGEDAGKANVDCDLPEYMHVDIIKRAVMLYRESVSGGITTQQNSDRANQQEAVRNNYRNEGYQN